MERSGPPREAPDEPRALVEHAGRRFGATGLHDVVRDRWPDERVVTYWDYRAGMFRQECGMRIDLVLASEPVADRVRAAWLTGRRARAAGRATTRQ